MPATPYSFFIFKKKSFKENCCGTWLSAMKKLQRTRSIVVCRKRKKIISPFLTNSTHE